jgi:predicted enzyme related to lactoylglutathione lyase
VLVEPTEVGVGAYAQLLDPNGAAFGIVELSPELRQLA